MDKENKKKIDLGQNIIVSTVLFIVSAILLCCYNWSLDLRDVCADSKTDLLWLYLVPSLSGLLYLLSIIILSSSLYCKWKETNSKKYLISFIVSIVIGVAVGFTMYLRVILIAILYQ